MKIAIDPGVDGGIAWQNWAYAYAIKLPKSATGIVDRISTIATPDTRIYIEATGTYRKGNSAPKAVTFARHCGLLEGIVYGLGFEPIMVAPQTWQGWLSQQGAKIPHGNAAYAARKKAVREFMQERHPDLRVTNATADALGILAFVTAVDLRQVRRGEV